MDSKVDPGAGSAQWLRDELEAHMKRQEEFLEKFSLDLREDLKREIRSEIGSTRRIDRQVSQSSTRAAPPAAQAKAEATPPPPAEQVVPPAPRRRPSTQQSAFQFVQDSDRGRAKIVQWFKNQFSMPPTFDRKPKKNTLLQKIVNSWAFTILNGGAIVSNAVYVGVYSEFTVSNEMKRLKGGDHVEPWFIFPLLFNSLFLIEICMRGGANGWDFWLGRDKKWNIFDAVLVTLPLWDVFSSESLTASLTSVPNLSYLRIARCARLIHTFELFRLPFFAHLRMITTAVLMSIPSFLWSAAIGSLILYAGAVAFLLGYARNLQNSNDWSPPLADLEFYFSSIDVAMMYLYMAVANGIDWEIMYWSVESMSVWYRIGFFLLIGFFLFAVLNIVSGMMIERAFKVVTNDRDFWILEENAQSEMYEDRVRGLFNQMDKDMSGTVTWDEFIEAVRNPHVRAYLSFIDIETNNIFDIFRMIDTENKGTILISELLDGINRLRGPAKRVEFKQLEREIDELKGTSYDASTRPAIPPFTSVHC